MVKERERKDRGKIGTTKFGEENLGLMYVLVVFVIPCRCFSFVSFFCWVFLFFFFGFFVFQLSCYLFYVVQIFGEWNYYWINY